MAEGSVLLRFKTQFLDRAQQIGRQILVTVQKADQVSKATRRELREQVRERLSSVRALRPVVAAEEKRAEALQGRARDLQRAAQQGGDLAARQAKQALSQGGKIAGVLGSLGTGVSATALAGILPQAALVAVAAQVFERIRDQVARERERDVAAIVELAVAEIERRQPSFAERIERDPQFRALQGLLAGRQLERAQAEADRLGLTREGLDSVLLPED